MSNPVGPADKGELAGTGIVRAAGHLLVHGLERGGMYMHDGFPFTRDWLWKLLTSRWFPELVHNRSIHDWFLATLFFT